MFDANCHVCSCLQTWRSHREEMFCMWTFFRHNTAFRNWLWRQKKTKTKQDLQLRESCLHVHMMDCHLIQLYHCISICFTSQSDIFSEKLLARQSCADSWRQHIKGLCGSVVSINERSRSFLPSGPSAHDYIIMKELPAMERRVRLLKEMELVPNKNIIVTHNIKDGPFQIHVILTGLCFLQGDKLPCVYFLFSDLLYDFS